MDWVAALSKEARRSSVIVASEFEKKYHVSPASLRKAFDRLTDRNLIERVTHKVYVNKLAVEFSATDLVNVLRPTAYVSLESALHHWGVSTQTPSILTCVSDEAAREYRGKSFALWYRQIAPKLLWGFATKQTRYGSYRLAEPEKALLDWLYLCLQDGIHPSVDELTLTSIKRDKLIDYAKRYPSSVFKFLLNTVVIDSFAA